MGEMPDEVCSKDWNALPVLLPLSRCFVLPHAVEDNVWKWILETGMFGKQGRLAKVQVGPKGQDSP